MMKENRQTNKEKYKATIKCDRQKTGNPVLKFNFFKVGKKSHSFQSNNLSIVNIGMDGIYDSIKDFLRPFPLKIGMKKKNPALQVKC